MYVIAGVTGHTGKVAAETLLDRGQKLRVIVREPEQGEPWKKRGAEVAIANLDDEAGLARAFAGAKGAYVLLPPDPTSTDFLARGARITQAVAAAAQKSQLPHVVLLSSIGAQHAKGTGPIAGVANAERVLEKTVPATTFVRASYFLENFGAGLQPAQTDGVLPSFLPAHFKLDVVSTRDIGKTVAQALLDGPRGHRVIELSGPAEVTTNDAAEALAKILDRPVKVAEAPLSAVVPTFMSFGMSQNVAELYREMIGAFIDGFVRWEGKGERARGQVSLAEGLRGMLGK